MVTAPRALRAVCAVRFFVTPVKLLNSYHSGIVIKNVLYDGIVLHQLVFVLVMVLSKVVFCLHFCLVGTVYMR